MDCCVGAQPKASEALAFLGSCTAGIAGPRLAGS